MAPTTRATLEDVARLAGVSLGTASRALSVPGQVRPPTLARVQQAVAQLGYVRNGAAQALASRRTRTIAAIYPTLANPIFADSVQAMQETLWTLGQHQVAPVGRERAQAHRRDAEGLCVLASEEPGARALRWATSVSEPGMKPNSANAARCRGGSTVFHRLVHVVEQRARQVRLAAAPKSSREWMRPSRRA